LEEEPGYEKIIHLSRAMKDGRPFEERGDLYLRKTEKEMP
jgi:hypothetical protein